MTEDEREAFPSETLSGTRIMPVLISGADARTNPH